MERTPKGGIPKVNVAKALGYFLVWKRTQERKAKRAQERKEKKGKSK